MSDFYYFGIGVAGVAAVLLVLVGLRYPVWFFYASLAGTAMLKTPELPVVREKVTVVEAFLLLLWGCWFVLNKGRIRKTVSPEALRWGAAFCIVCLVSSVVAIGTAPPHLQNIKMVAFSLIEAANYCYGVAILWTAISVLDTWERWVGAIVAWVAGVALVSFVGSGAMVGVAPGWAFEETGRICSTLRNENQVPSMILPVLVAMVVMAVRAGVTAPFRIVLLLLSVTTVATAIGTGSRTAALMLVVGGFGLYWILVVSSQARQSVNTFFLFNLAAGFSLLVAGYFWLAWAMYDGRYSLVTTPSWQRPAVLLIEWYQGDRELDTTRPQQIAAAMRYFWSSPILGTGPKFGAQFALTRGEVHNTYFSLLLETGILGLATFVPLIALAFIRGSEATRLCRFPWFAVLGRALLVGLLMLCLYNATILGLRQRNIWFLLGMIFAFCDLVASNVSPVNRRIAGVPSGLMALFCDWQPVLVRPVTWLHQRTRAVQGGR